MDVRLLMARSAAAPADDHRARGARLGFRVDAKTKALVERRTARYGAPCRITKAGKVRVFKSAPAKPAPRIEHDDVLAAREYLKALGIAT